jgi:hypothetical protein
MCIQIDSFTIDTANYSSPPTKAKLIPYINMSCGETAIVVLATGAIAFSLWALT